MNYSKNQLLQDNITTFSRAETWFKNEGLDKVNEEDHAIFKVGRLISTFAEKRLRATGSSHDELRYGDYTLKMLKMSKKVDDKHCEWYNYGILGRVAGLMAKDGTPWWQGTRCKFGMETTIPTTHVLNNTGAPIVIGREHSGKWLCDKLDHLVLTESKMPLIESKSYMIPVKYGDYEILPVQKDVKDIPDSVAKSIEILTRFGENNTLNAGDGDVKRDGNGIMVMPVLYIYRQIVQMHQAAKDKR